MSPVSPFPPTSVAIERRQVQENLQRRQVAPSPRRLELCQSSRQDSKKNWRANLKKESRWYVLHGILYSADSKKTQKSEPEKNSEVVHIIRHYSLLTSLF